jgi:hypothetical protein
MVGHGSRPPRFAAIMLGLLLLIGWFTPALQLAGATLSPFSDKGETNSTLESAGPTLHLDNGRGESPGNTVAEFMYFVPLISLEPVSVLQSPGNTQGIRRVSATRSFMAASWER